MDDEDKVTLVVHGTAYGGWKSIRITRSIESLAGSFALGVSDRWDGEFSPWPIAEEDPCRVEINGTAVIDGYVDTRDVSGSKEERSLAYGGRDKAAALVDCTTQLSRLTYRNVTLADFVKALAAPFGVSVSVQAGLALSRVPKISASPGDTAFEAIKRAAADAAVLLVSDGAGGIVITRASSARATSLVEGSNVLHAASSYDGKERYYRYRVVAQAAGTDTASGNATRILAEAIDEGVRRTDRVLEIRAERSMTVADARRRADWEARTRAAKSETVTVTVQGWRQPSGDLWPVNAIAHVKAPRLAGVDGELLISEVENSIDDKAGRITQIKLLRPDAFTPEPVLAKVKASGGAWKELNRGGL
jgi:prophage tail gpP-like protein